MKIPHNPNEVLAIVDENDNIIGQEIRKEIHSKGLLHRETYCYIINFKKQLLLQKRADNNLWDNTIAGHFPYTQNFEEAIIREAEEEIGLKIRIEELKLITKEKINNGNKLNNRIIKVFLLQKDIKIEDLKLDLEEVAEMKYFNKEELEKLLSTNDMTNTSKYIINKYFLSQI